MSKLISGIFGGGDDKLAKMQRQQADAAQRRQLADLAAKQAETDRAAGVTGSKKRGRSLLTFLGSEGQASLG